MPSAKCQEPRVQSRKRGTRDSRPNPQRCPWMRGDTGAGIALLAALVASFAAIRNYGPLEPWFDRTWKFDDIEPCRHAPIMA